MTENTSGQNMRLNVRERSIVLDYLIFYSVQICHMTFLLWLSHYTQLGEGNVGKVQFAQILQNSKKVEPILRLGGIF